ncbi:MAG: SPOR domain-containing protein [bacterium]|nr:SPOR domain-containing protein [bacterium]
MKLLICIIGIICLGSVVGYTNPNQWLKAMEKGDWETLEAADKSGKLTEPWKLLLAAFKTEDGDSAAKQYERIVSLYPNDKAAQFAQRRLSEYAAMGGKLPTPKETMTPSLETSGSVPSSTVPLQTKEPFQTPTSVNTPAPIETSDQVTSPTKIEPAPISPTAPPLGGKFAAQFGAYSTPERANALAERLKRYGFSAEVAPTQRDGKTFYRVWGGRFATRGEAQQCIHRVLEEVDATLPNTVVEIK